MSAPEGRAKLRAVPALPDAPGPSGRAPVPFWRAWPYRGRQYRVLSRVPFTPQWRLYRDVLAWIAACDDVLREFAGVPEEWPVYPPPGRDVDEMSVAVSSMVALAEAIEREAGAKLHAVPEGPS